jgi:predicted small lipoprotein YifL
MIRVFPPLLLLCLVVLLAACGNKGDLIKPSADTKSAAAAMPSR